ncbi:acyltransferase family protein [Gordonia aichiensis]
MAHRIPSLTGVRAFAAGAVCLTHAAFWTGHYTDDYGGRLFSRFEVGVAIFFVLSGFLLFSEWIRPLREGRALPSTRRYFWHRARRILPAYWITVMVVYLVYGWYSPSGEAAVTGTGWSGFWRNMTLTQVYGVGHLHNGLTQMWSLAAEVVFYLLLPAIAWVLIVVVSRRRWRPDLLIGGLLVIGLVSPVWAILVDGNPDADPTARLWAPAFLGWFVAGMVVAVCAPLIRKWNTWMWLGAAAIAFVVSGLPLAGEPTITPSTASATIVKHLLYLVVAVGVVGPLTSADQSSVWARLCGSRIVVWLGEISYEFFLVHVLVLEVVMDLLNYRVFDGNVVVAFVVTTAISIPAAWALHRVTRPLWRAPTPGAPELRR